MERKPDDVTSRPQARPPRGDSTDARSPADRPSRPGDVALPSSPTPARGRPGRLGETESWDIERGPSGTAAPASHHDELDKILPGPGHADEVDELVRERMEEDSPDGRPPTLAGRRDSRYLFFGALTAVWLVVLTAVWWIGGIALAALVLAITAIYIGFAAWPAWRAALERRGDTHRAEREIEAESHPVAPPDRQPPAQSR
jgi:hypothetical protein